MATIGNIGPFDSAEETWQSYTERFELFVDCNGINATKKASTLLTVMGVRTYKLLKDLITPDKPSSKTYEEIVDTVGKHLHPKPSFITERFKFSRRHQLEHETVSDYIVQLKQLSQHCEFGDKLPDHLRDRLVSGLKNHHIQRRLLGEDNLTYDKAVQLATSMEFAEKGAAQMTLNPGGRLQRLSQTTRTAPSGSGGKFAANRGSATSQPRECNCCGKNNHNTLQCRYRWQYAKSGDISNKTAHGYFP
ncbi:uncharacterized protein LOC129002894 [Macrosteles quadrilineatus]|nr:uncharacterized protein LOC129002894 [Macrosteles quadrilineatus]